jgi:hypothetical protein
MHGGGDVTRITRYQGAIIRDHHILLIKQTEALRVAYREALKQIIAQEQADTPGPNRKIIAEARKAQQDLEAAR